MRSLPDATEQLEACEPQAWVAGTVVGAYRVLGKLGSGGMSHVYDAERLRTGQRVALKVPHRSGLRSTARTLREARVAMGISSEHVARVLEVELDPSGDPFIVMARLEGQTLAERLQEVGSLHWREATELIMQACAGVAAIHECGLIHRDLKPSNLFLERAEGGARVKVIDLGIALPALQHRTASASGTELVGTVAYAAPEQLRAAAEVGPSADIWSLGVSLHQLLTGALPFEGSSIAEVMLSILEGRRCRAREVVAAVPEELQSVLDECLRPTPTLRPASAEDLARNLGRVLEGQVVGDEFRTGRNFRIRLRGRLFVLVWVGMPTVEDIELILQAAADAHARVGAQLVELVLAPPGLGEPAVWDHMSRRMPLLKQHFERFYAVVDAKGIGLNLLQRAMELVAAAVQVRFRIGARSTILPLVSASEGIPVLM